MSLTPFLSQSGIEEAAPPVDLVLSIEGSHLSDQLKIEVARTVKEVAGEYTIDPLLILAIMKVESSFRPNVASHRGAVGFMQVRTIAAREAAKELSINPNISLNTLSHHELNIRIGAHYFASLLRRFGGNVWKALSAYNRGPTAVSRNFGSQHITRESYPGKVLRAYLAYSRLRKEPALKS
ncbi:MAG: lytic transglycosylase domain-containing protein [Deltaproteobacteria bacterium]|nr:lytic transglycosylase domain-containing protein [Deltaproteobacteria bacterium]